MLSFHMYPYSIHIDICDCRFLHDDGEDLDFSTMAYEYRIVSILNGHQLSEL